MSSFPFRPPRPAALLILGLLAAAPALAARRHAPAPVAEVAAQADTIVHGQVTGAVTREVGYQVVTTYTVAPIGDPDATEVTVELPGGRQGDRTVTVPGVPVWSSGDTVVVCLDASERPLLDGVFTVREAVLVDPWARAPEPTPLRVLVPAPATVP